MAKTNSGKSFRWVLILSLLANAFAVFYFGRKIYNRYTAEIPAPPSAKKYYLDRDQLFEVLPADTAAIVFLGNSLTQYFELAELLQSPHVKNRGIHGDMINGTLDRLGPVIKMQPKKIFIEIGINDLEQGITIKAVLKNYGQLIDTLKLTCSKAKIYVQSLLPVADTSQPLPSYCSPQRNTDIVTVNNALRELAESKGCVFINVHSTLLYGNQLNPKFSVDGVHLSGEGYLAWAKVLKPFIEK